MEMNEGHVLVAADNTIDLCMAQIELTLNHTKMSDLIKSGTKFDVIIIDWFLNAPILIYGSLLKAPVIPLASQGVVSIAGNIIGNFLPPSYVPSPLVGFSPNMTFIERFSNGLLNLAFKFYFTQIWTKQQEMLAKYFEKPPTFEELQDQIALILANGHYSYESPRPTIPNLVPIGGFHVQKAKALPKDLQKFMDEAETGVIFFSLGSNMKSTLLPEEKQNEILRVLARIPYRVLWKWENDHLPGKPENVMVRKWFPQNDVLGKDIILNNF